MNLAKTLSRRRLLLVTFVGCVLALAFILHFIFNRPVQSSLVPISTHTTTPYKQEKVSPGFPLRLKIPSINVDAALDYVALTPQGELAAPKGPANAGWYDRGPRPGEVGSSVIDGHFGWTGGVPAVFDNLSKLLQGDKLYVEDEKGVIIPFVVRETRNYDPKADATGVFRSSDGKAHLNLITCEGAWNAAQKSYSNRLVVFTDKVL